jgi:hypothetical protein
MGIYSNKQTVFFGISIVFCGLHFEYSIIKSQISLVFLVVLPCN